MNDAQRIFYSAKNLVTGASPYRDKRSVAPTPLASSTAAYAAAAPQDVFQRDPRHVSAALHHHKYMPGDIGMPELSDADADNFAAPPPDLDELAACAGQSRVFGPMVGRLIMAVGSFFALYAVVAATKALREDAGTVEELAAAKENLSRRPFSKAAHALGGLFDREVRERQQARVSNAVMLPGAVGMAINLLGSAELFGHVMPALVPIANFAMGPAAICMTLYGAYIALTCAQAWHHSRNIEAQRAGAAGGGDVPVSGRLGTLLAALKGREGQKRFWDVALGLCGAMQAAGALLQWALGPIYLLLLLPGTLGLVLFKLLRAKALGTQTVPAHLDVARYDKPFRALMTDYDRAQQRTAKLRAIGPCDGRDGQMLRHKLHEALATDGAEQEALLARLRMDAPAPTQQAQDLVYALAELGAFPYLALEVARSRTLPRMRGAREDGADYTVTAEDIVELVRSAPAVEATANLAALRQLGAQVVQSYGVAIARQHEGILAELLGQMLDEMRSSTLAHAPEVARLTSG